MFEEILHLVDMIGMEYLNMRYYKETDPLKKQLCADLLHYQLNHRLDIEEGKDSGQTEEEWQNFS